MASKLVRRPFEGPDRTAVEQANASRNAKAPPDRARRWRVTRDAVWAMVEPVLTAGDRVAVVGAGNADDIPLRRLAAVASRVDLIDIDVLAPRGAIRRLDRRSRRRVRAMREDVTGGVGDRIVAAARHGAEVDVEVPADAVGDGPYDVVIGDLFYSQLLYPAMLDEGVDDRVRHRLLRTHGRPLVEGVVQRLHVSAPAGHILHLHDCAGWWEGHTQPVSIHEVLAMPIDDALALRFSGPRDVDPRAALVALGHPITATRLWCWSFTDGVDYLVCATLSPGPPA
jgi:hypothetical protein